MVSVSILKDTLALAIADSGNTGVIEVNGAWILPGN